MENKAISKQNEVHNALFDMAKTSLSSSADQDTLHLQEHLELCEDMFNDFYRTAQRLIDRIKKEHPDEEED